MWPAEPATVLEGDNDRVLTSRPSARFTGNYHAAPDHASPVAAYRGRDGNRDHRWRMQRTGARHACDAGGAAAELEPVWSAARNGAGGWYARARVARSIDSNGRQRERRDLRQPERDSESDIIRLQPRRQRHDQDVEVQARRAQPVELSHWEHRWGRRAVGHDRDVRVLCERPVGGRTLGMWVCGLSLIHISEPTRRTPISY